MPRTRVHYGKHHGQVADLWLPNSLSGDLPVIVLIHGGFWRAPYTKSLMSGLAKSVVRRGWAAWNIEYRRVGHLGGNGGWPATFDDVASAIDHLSTLKGVDCDQVITCGHSAGGQLALWAAGRTGMRKGSPGFPVKVTIRAAISLAGIVDLEEADRLGLGDDATSKFLGGHKDQQPDRYKVGSPASLLPLGVEQVLVHGTEDRVVPASMSARYQQEATAAGDDARYIALEGVNHRQVIDPRGGAWTAALAEFDRILR